MKSLLQEAPSIERAISKAWESVGRPAEFSVKIHEQGETSFFGFSSKPAVVSITYKPVVAPGASGSATSSRAPRPAGARSEGSRSSDRSERSERSPRFERSERPDRSERPERAERPERHDRSERSERFERPERQERSERHDHSERGERFERPDSFDAAERSEGSSERSYRQDRSERPERSDRNDRRRSGDRRDAVRRNDRSSGPGVRSRGLLSYEEGEEGYSALNSDATNMNSYIDALDQSSNESLQYHGGNQDDNGAGDAWETSYVDSINAWLNEIISTIGYDVTFKSSVSGKILHVEFNSDFVVDAELSRSLYAALSFVLLQFLKREHKRRFRGLRIALTHPGQEPLRFDLGS